MSASAEAYVSPAEGAVEPHTTIVGGTKPLHRFIRGEPKCIGIVLVFLGGSLFIFGIPMKMDPAENSAHSWNSFWIGILFIICGVLYIISEHNPTKQLVTASLALSIISILGVAVVFIELLKVNIYHRYMRGNTEEDPWYNHHFVQVHSMEAVFMLHVLVGGVLLITVTAFARAALRSSKTQAVVMMNSIPSSE